MIKVTGKAVRQIVRTLDPETRNPQNKEGKCLYTSSRGKHCIAGEVLTRLGVDVPRYRTKENSTSIVSLFQYGWFEGVEFTEAAQRTLSELQNAADIHENQNTWSGPARKWGDAIKEAKI